MLNVGEFCEWVSGLGVTFFTGVPDSLLKSFSAYAANNIDDETHVIAANEGNAVGLGIGHHLATGGVPLVYLQNSGIGNIINPLLSLCDPEIYSIPMVFLIGWRGKPGEKDEPQHVKQGRVLINMLDSMEIPSYVLTGHKDKDWLLMQTGVERAIKTNAPISLVVPKDTFESYDFVKGPSCYSLCREDVLKALVDVVAKESVVVSTTGMASRELYEYRAALGQGHGQDFLTVGGMGHASQIALGIALAKTNVPVVCVDGDGAAIMHLGGMAIAGSRKCKNFKHLIVNNGAHDSVGGQPTVGFDIDFNGIARSLGYKVIDTIVDETNVKEVLVKFVNAAGPVLLEVKVKKGARKNLGRPVTTPKENKIDFMRSLLGQDFESK